tara:strand:+ start:3128 stop:4240 length:1113 start_codon:yes stop_codon:yes gene_type:complete
MPSDKTLNSFFQPYATNSHSNIDDLIFQNSQPKQTIRSFYDPQSDVIDALTSEDFLGGVKEVGSRIFRDADTPYTGGLDDVTANVAMGPILTLKSILGSKAGAKFAKSIGLKTPLSHFTSGSKAMKILKEGRIRGAEGAFQGKPFKGDSRKALDKLLEKDKTGWLSETDIKFNEQFPKSPAVSVTRDPKFLSRPHGHVDTDIQLIMDRNAMIKKGLKIESFAEGGYGKTLNDYSRFPLKLENYKNLHGYYPNQMNPMFEFEERVRGNIPGENIKLINFLKLPFNNATISPENIDIIKSLSKSGVPMIKSPNVQKSLDKFLRMLDNGKRTGNFPKELQRDWGIDSDFLESLDDIRTKVPTYKFDPFKKANP